LLTDRKCGGHSPEVGSTAVSGLRLLGFHPG
jgi:hypothetical protein